MPFNGSGTFSRVYNWVTDKNNSINITASRVDTEDTGFATGLSNCICKDGQTTITANLPMSSFIHTGVGNASARNHYAVVGGIQDGLYNWVAGGGTADVITASYSPAVTALVDGMELNFRATAANATTTPTFSPNGVTAHTITKKGGSALAAGDIVAAAFEGKLRYNLANTRWELTNPGITAPANNTVTNAMLAQMGANTVKMNNTGSTGNAVDATGAQAAASLGLFITIKSQVFPSNGTYTPSAGMIYCQIRAIGGGGGGGGVSAVSGATAGGGAAGSEATLVASAATIGASKAVTIGAGGIAGANTGGNGGTGGTTTVGSTLISATGGLGGGGSTGASSPGGAGQASTVGDVLGTGAPGGPGVAGSSNTLDASGVGGSSSLGGGAISVVGSSAANGNNGVDNTGGGGSGANAGAGTAKTGGVGGKGYVIITEWCSQ